MEKTNEERMSEFMELVSHEQGRVYVDRFEDEVRVVILRGPGSLCAYLGIPIDHPLAGTDYNDLNVSCNGGLTYGGGRSIDALSSDRYWYGWDHAHCSDLCFYQIQFSTTIPDGAKPWLVEDVEAEIWSAVYDLKKCMQVAEKAFIKGAKWREVSKGEGHGKD